MMAAMDEGADLSSLRMAVSAGETLPAPVFEDWTTKTGKPILDGIGTTEMLHIFISNRLGDAAPGVTGTSGDRLRGAGSSTMTCSDVPRGTPGQLAVRGPDRLPLSRRRSSARLRARRLECHRRRFRQDEDGVFRFVARADDMIISAGYNIAGPEVEAALLSHADVAECAVDRCAGCRARPDRAGARRAEAGRRTRRGYASSACRTTSRRRLRPTNIRGR